MTDTSQAAFEAMAKAAYETLPEPFRKMSADVLIRVVDQAPDDVLQELRIDHPMGLLGLYQGVDFSRKSVYDTGTMPDMVFLYRLPIIQFWKEGTDTLEHIVAHVLIHEIGHHFGLSDDDMDEIEREED